MSNHLKKQSSPYLLQHAGNPVDWYPWCEEAFEKAADGKATKIIIPSEIQGMAGLAASVKELVSDK